MPAVPLDNPLTDPLAHARSAFGFRVRTVSAAFCLAAAALLGGCGGGSSSSSAASGSAATATAPEGPVSANSVAVYVDAGPAGSGYNANRLYTDVTVCPPSGASPCQTIPHILVDTGSTGLRLLSSAMDSSMKLAAVTGSGGQALVNCVRFVDGSFGWGPVVSAHVRLGAKQASNVPIQVMADPAVAGSASRCSGGSATPITSASALGANGILGVGLFKEDCGSACVASAAPGHYFRCGNASCSSVVGSVAALSSQVKNPVPLFASDNNGVMIALPAPDAANRARLDGLLVFGIGTQANNQFAGSKVLPTDALGYITATYEGRALPVSFIDSGSNGLFVDSSTLPLCLGGVSFYCPAVLTAQVVILTGTSGGSVQVDFLVENATASFVGSNPVLPYLVGDFGSARTFDLGLPFFYGRRVFFGIEGMSSPLGTGPFYAF